MHQDLAIQIETKDVSIATTLNYKTQKQIQYTTMTGSAIFLLCYV